MEIKFFPQLASHLHPSLIRVKIRVEARALERIFKMNLFTNFVRNKSKDFSRNL